MRQGLGLQLPPGVIAAQKTIIAAEGDDNRHIRNLHPVSGRITPPKTERRHSVNPECRRLEKCKFT
jgi:hypothetical protein